MNHKTIREQTLKTTLNYVKERQRQKHMRSKAICTLMLVFIPIIILHNHLSKDTLEPELAGHLLQQSDTSLATNPPVNTALKPDDKPFLYEKITKFMSDEELDLIISQLPHAVIHRSGSEKHIVLFKQKE